MSFNERAAAVDLLREVMVIRIFIARNPDRAGTGFGIDRIVGVGAGMNLDGTGTGLEVGYMT